MKKRGRHQTSMTPAVAQMSPINAIGRRCALIMAQAMNAGVSSR